jgi:hypothetical protein
MHYGKACFEIGNVPWKFPKSEAVLKAVHTFTVGKTPHKQTFLKK